MEQIDVIDYQQNLKRNRLKRFIKNKQVITALSYGISQIPFVILQSSSFFKVLSGALIGAELLLLRHYWEKEQLNEKAQTIAMLRTTTTYKELLTEYQKYIKDVIKLLNIVGLKNAKENIAYIYRLMELGYFAKQTVHQYKIFKHEKDLLQELYGAKIVTGTCVCRHMSSFIVDVMNEMGYTATNIVCTSSEDLEKIPKRNLIFDHAVVGVAEQGSKFLFDATSGHFIVKPIDLDFSETDGLYAAQYVINNEKLYLMACRCSEGYHKEIEKRCNIINASKLCTMTYSEAQYLMDKIDNLLVRNMYNNFLFHTSHEQQRTKIEELYKELLPYSDEEIKTHIVRK